MKKSILLGLLMLFVVTMTAQGGIFSFLSRKDNNKVELKFLLNQPRLFNIYQKYTDKFVEKYNENSQKELTITIESFPANQYPNILKSKIAAGDKIDLYMLHASNELGEFIQGGLVESLNDTTLADVLYEGAAKSVTSDGNIYALPLESTNWAMLYNKDLFKELGIEPADNLSELREIVGKLKSVDKTPFLLSYQETWIPQLFLPLVVGTVDSKTGFIDRMNEGNASFKEIQSELFGIIDIVHSNGNKKPFEIGGSSGSAKFASGEYGMWVQGPWFAETILDVNPDLNFGVAPLPVNEKNEYTQIMQAVTTSIVVAKNSDNKEIAKEFLEFLISEEIASDFFEELKFNPVAKTQDYEVFPWVEDSVKYIKEKRSYSEKHIPQSVKDESGKLIQEYYSGAKSQEDVIKELDKTWETYIRVSR